MRWNRTRGNESEAFVQSKEKWKYWTVTVIWMGIGDDLKVWQKAWNQGLMYNSELGERRQELFLGFFWGWLRKLTESLFHHCLQVKLFLCSWVYEQKIWVTFPARKEIQDRASQQLGTSPGWVHGDTLVKVHRTHILYWQSFRGLALCHLGTRHRVSCYSSLHRFMEALWTITMIWCGF